MSQPVRMMTVREVAEMMQVSDATVLNWIDTGQLLASNVTSQPHPRRPQWRIHPDDLRKFTESRRVLRRRQEPVKQPRLAVAGVIQRY